MSRSVSVPHYAEAVAYTAIDPDNVEDFQDQVIEPLVYSLKKAFPSLYEDDQWLDREDHVIARNRHGLFGISEYCGLLAVWIVPADEESNLSAPWCARAEAKLCAVVQDVFGLRLRSVGCASNGEQFFERVES